MPGVFSPLIYIGGSDYSAILSASTSKIILTPDVTGAYPLAGVGFGQLSFTG